jgi:hypothetical protein
VVVEEAEEMVEDMQMPMIISQEELEVVEEEERLIVL